ncbi:hypothetical protein ACFX2I_011485 [Malus domestica]
MESNHIVLKQNLGLFDILNLNLTYKYTHFIQLTFLSSLPLFCFSLVYNSGSERQRRQGLDISLVFSVFGLSLRGSCLFFACCGGRNGVVAHVGVFCIVNVMKWVVFVVYFNNCKRQSLVKKVDEVVVDDGLTNAKTAYDVHVPPDEGLDVRTC